MASGSLLRNYSTTPANNELTVPFGAPVNWYPSEVSPVVRQHMTDTRVQCENAEWFNWGHTATQTSATTFTIPTDVRAIYLGGRRLRITDATVLVGTITAVSYSAPNTTVTVSLDSGALSSLMNGQNVEVGILSPTNSSIPISTANQLYTGQAVMAVQNTYTVTMTSPKITAYEIGRVYRIYFPTGTTNTGNSSLNINGLGPVNILPGPANLNTLFSLKANDLREGFFYEFLYDGVSFELLNASNNTLGAVLSDQLSTAGFINFRTGFSMQWGTASVPAGINTAINLVRAYPNATLHVYCQVEGDEFTEAEFITVNTLTPTTFSARCATDVTFSWFSIGH